MFRADPYTPQREPGSISNGGTSLLYTPATGFYGRESFGYTSAGTAGDTVEATVRVDVSKLWHNHFQPADVNRDGFVSAIDVLLLVNALNGQGAIDLPAVPAAHLANPPCVDTNDDAALTSLDVLMTMFARHGIEVAGG